MGTEQKSSKSIFSKIGNLLFIAFLLLLVFSTDAKSWLLGQMVSIGLFNTEINKEAVKDSKDLSFNFVDADGKTVSTAELKGKVVFINFWATWCPPCRAEMPSLHSLYEKLQKDDRFVFLFINEDDDVGKAKVYLEEKGFSFPIIKRVGKVPEEIFSGTLPTTVVLNKEGQIVLKKEGLANYNTTSFLDQLKSLL